MDRDGPPAAISAATWAASRIAATERSSVYAYPTESPTTTRTPSPRSTLVLASLTFPSERVMDVVDACSK